MVGTGSGGNGNGHVEKVGAVAVVGAGIAGMQASLDLAETGYKVFLIERSSGIGGRMAQLDKTFPTNDCAMCTISPKLVETGRHPNIEILTDTEVLDVAGQAGAFDARLRRMMPQGALLRAELDEDFWLAYGLPADITVWFGGDDPLIATPPVAVAAGFADQERLHLGGLLWPEAAARLARTAYATREGVGRGQVILFADHPGYRRWVVESERLLKNAILLGPGLGTRWSAPW